MNNTKDRLVIHPTDLAQWQALIKEAQNKSSKSLNEELESYLVFLLMRFTTQPDMVSSTIALDFLENLNTAGPAGQDRWREIGDKCLLFAGLFPGRAHKRQVDISYFVNMGQSAYSMIAIVNHSQSVVQLFQALCEKFVLLKNILQATRTLPLEDSDLFIHLPDTSHEELQEHENLMRYANVKSSRH